MLHLVCLAYTLLIHLPIERHGAQGQGTGEKAAGMSVALCKRPSGRWSGMTWSPMKEQHHGKRVLAKPEWLRIARNG
jgi:hypothetical protein